MKVLRSYRWAERLWYVLTVDGWKVAAMQGPPPTPRPGADFTLLVELAPTEQPS